MAELIGECIFLVAIFSCGVMMGWSTRPKSEVYYGDKEDTIDRS